MTARKPTNADRDNSGVDASENGGLTNDDAQQLINYINDVGSCSIDELAGWSRLPHAYLKQLLQELEEDGLIESSQGYHKVRNTATDSSDRSIATDGGYIPGNGTTGIDIDLDVDLEAAELHRAIGNTRRRQTIRVLAGASMVIDLSDGPCSEYVKLSDLTDALISHSNIGLIGNVDSKRRNSVYNSLAQSHLPLLEELGLVEYHDRVQKIKPTSRVRETARLLDLIDSVSAKCDARPGVETFTGLVREEEQQ